MATFPQDIIIDILLRLRVKSLCRFRCVSKQWFNLINDPHFIKTHLKRNDKRKKIILASSGHSGLYSVHRRISCPNVRFPKEINFPLLKYSGFWDCIFGSCDGLLLIEDGKDVQFLINPSTREFKRLPKSRFDIRYLPEKYEIFCSYGLGYDSKTDDYKVVRICHSYRLHEYSENIVSVYSLKTNSWRRIQESPYDHSDSNPFVEGVYLNGFLHWLVSGRMDSDDNPYHSSMIASFDIANEEFRDVRLPSFLEGASLYTLGVLEGCLCVLTGNGFEVDVWIMKEYGVKDSWTKFTIPISSGFLKPLLFTKNGKVLLHDEDGERELVLYNTKEGAFREVLLNGDHAYRSGVYVESLVSPNYNNTIDRQHRVLGKRRRTNGEKNKKDGSHRGC